MTQSFVGHNLCEFLADKIVDLIYHPSWRITLMQVIADINKTLKNPNIEQNPFAAEDFKPLTDFLFQHFFKNSNIPFEGSMTPLVDYFTGDDMFNLLKNFMKPSDDSLLEKALESLLPTIRELMLYSHVIDSFRKERIAFEGDAKFWEIYLRESLNLLISNETLSLPNPTLSDIAEIRKTFVEKMLLLDKCKLRELLCNIRKEHPLQHHWTMVTDSPPTEAALYGTDSEIKVNWDYLANSSEG